MPPIRETGRARPDRADYVNSLAETPSGSISASSASSSAVGGGVTGVSGPTAIGKPVAVRNASGDTPGWIDSTTKLAVPPGEDAERGDDTIDVAGRGDEVEPLDEGPRVVLGPPEDDPLGRRHQRRAAGAAGQADFGPSRSRR